MHDGQKLSALTVLLLFMIQSACSGTANVILPTSTVVVTNTLTPIRSTLMPTETVLPSEIPSPTPAINGTWSEEPAMLIPRSAHAVASSDSTIYALAGTDDSGKPVLEVEAFDGKQWKTETTLPGEGLNAPTASMVGHRLY